MKDNKSKNEKNDYDKLIKSELEKPYQKNQFSGEVDQNGFRKLPKKTYSDSLLEILTDRLKIFDIVREFIGRK